MLLFIALSLALLPSSYSQLGDCFPSVLAKLERCSRKALDSVLPSKEEAIQLIEDVLSCMEPSGCTLTEEMKDDAEEFEAQRECAKKSVREVITPKLEKCFIAQRPEFIHLPLPDTDKLMDLAFVFRSAKYNSRTQKQLMDSCGSQEGIESLLQCILEKSPIKSMVSELLEDCQSDFIKTKLKIFTDLVQCYKAASSSCIQALMELGGVMCGCVESDLMSDGKPSLEVASAFQNCGMLADQDVLLGGVLKLCSFRTTRA